MMRSYIGMGVRSMKDKKKAEAPKCQYNIGVECRLRERPCESCGWNPAVAKERLDRFYTDHGIVAPDKKED